MYGTKTTSILKNVLQKYNTTIIVWFFLETEGCDEPAIPIWI